MNESQQKQGQSRLLLNTVMILLETIYSFVLKHDAVVRLQAKKFIKQQTIIKINSYIPYFDFYVQFTEKGLLFELKAPEEPIDLSVNTTLIDLIQILVFANARSIKKMRLEGDNHLKEQFKDLILHMSLPKLLSDWKNWLTQADTEHETRTSNQRIQPLLEKIDTQRSKINTLQVEVKQYQNRLKKMQLRQKRLTTVFYIITLLFITLIMYNCWVFF